VRQLSVSRSNQGMAKQTNSDPGFPSDLLVDVRNGRGAGIRERLEAALRSGIQGGQLVAGAALPPSRVLADELGISRSVVVEAYGNLAAGGYLEARAGAGTWVRRDPHVTHPPLTSGAPTRAPIASPRFQPPRRPSPAPGAPTVRLFGGLPDPALFPRTRWLRHYRSALVEVPDPDLTYPDMLGAPSLRAALTAYLGRVRGVATTADRILVCSGFTQGLILVCRALRRRGARRVAVEDPCFAHHRTAIERTGLATVPVAVDAFGLDPDGLPDDVAAVLVAPAHSYPSGGTLDAGRRHALIAWAARTGATIIEDDYDAEFRYDRQPIGALQGLAPEYVVHIGCASKTFTPALRLGWIAAPQALVDDLEQEKLYDDMGSNLLDQLAFARFMDSGDFSRHLRRVRPVYRARRDATLSALATHIPEVQPQGEAAGLHLHVLLPEGIDELEFAAEAYARGVLVEDGAWHWAQPEKAPASIVLGYGSVGETAIRRGIAILAEALPLAFANA
jgi:GntR family transcriptional regulator / MocR family aminotransferase